MDHAEQFMGAPAPLGPEPGLPPSGELRPMRRHSAASVYGALGGGEWWSVNQVAKALPGRPHRNVVWRWIRKGIKDRQGGRVVKLAAVRVGWQWYVSPEAVERFVEAMTGDGGAGYAEGEKTRRRSAAGLARGYERAMTQLKALGVVS